ncbi:MAG TPA: dienelactone hydrolase family protein, partial [Caulobacteraceae bacterium]|nr:dienelactone hydrolase family protein [Caulobacteraceae bacterium]
MSRTEIALPTPDGSARAFVFNPEGKGPWPAVIFFMDAPAIRPALFEMCERLASHGYYVLLPDMFWRAGAYPPVDIAAVFNDENARREIFGKLMASTDPEKQMRDVGACLDYLAKQPEVKGDKVGVTGYCMGG